MIYCPNKARYDNMIYRTVGNSGLKLPAVSLGLWNNFGAKSQLDTAQAMVETAYDLGITHFDLANNYGPPPGAAEETFGRILKKSLANQRDQLIISTKAGYTMWDGPYGDWGSKKYLTASLDQSLLRMGLDYVDLFYHHRPDPNTPMYETVDALEQMIRAGKALYIGISNYETLEMKAFVAECDRRGIHCLINQYNYSMLRRNAEESLLDYLTEAAVGLCAYMPLSQGRLTNRYLDGIPKDSRAAGDSTPLSSEQVDEKTISKVRALTIIAEARKQTMAQLAISWVLRHPETSTALIGASKPEQITDAVNSLQNLHFTEDELTAIDVILSQ